MAEKQKILICGDVEGRFITLFNRVEAINKKSGPFDLLLCVGNFFGVNNKEFDTYKFGIKKVEVPTYVLGPNKEEHVKFYPEDGSELCPNVHYLGKRGVYTNSTGIKVAYMSGISSDGQVGGNEYTYTLEDAVFLKNLCKRGSSRGVDILVTSQWPNEVMRYDSTNKIKVGLNMHTNVAAWLALQLKPRYHLSGLEGQFYERAPFRNPVGNDSSLEIATRFLGLARVGNANKEKWIYAVSLTPIDKMSIKDLMQRTTDETQCPFNLVELENILFKNKRKPEENIQYFYDTNSPEPEQVKHKKRQKIEFDQSKCWFCLASPSVEKHLVVAVGNSVYLAVAKGGLVDQHLLICPVEHHQSSIALPDSVVVEVDKFKDALRSMYILKQMEPVFFERNYKTSHMQIQAVPIPLAAQKELKDIFRDEAEGHGFVLEELESHNRLDQVLAKGVPYFCVELPNKTILYTKIQSSMNFPINFGRQVLASGPILNLPDKIDWKECVVKKEIEEKLVASLRKAFKPFDFTE
ncbi:hypothetical protein PPYR_01632 [Photinus pyralis]|uniref:Cwf19-like C-terminal domain-containing protein n=1 Tax=Photinus pyralis TaxID=7054 RepID=A0A5N4B4Z3_PHOPY|nr:CWF19-like protein 1 [Photinus pyralis]KAB0804662.1 hypothetical protein PPYR_01632 [Photinus pyralis]